MYKKTLFAIFWVLCTGLFQKTFAVSDPAVDSLKFFPSTVVYPGGTAVVQFDFINTGTQVTSTFVKFSVGLAGLNFTNDLFNQATDIEYVSGSATFNWVRLPSNTLWATLNGTLPANSVIRIRIKNLNVTGPVVGANLNINTTPNHNSSLLNDNTNGVAFSAPPNPLPVSLTSFTAVCGQGRTVLKWATASELNNEKFVVSRSNDLQSWSMVATVSGAGNSNQTLHYDATDERPTGKLTYYRLTQYDYDGATETFAPVSIACDGAEISNSMLVFPNPATEQFTVSVSTAAEQEKVQAEIEIYNAEGKKVATRNVNLPKGTTQTTFDRNGLAPGQYFVKVSHPYLALKPIVVMLQ